MQTTKITDKINNDEPLSKYEDEFIKARIVSWAVRQLLRYPSDNSKQANLEYILYLTAISNLKRTLEHIENHESNMDQFNWR